MATEINQSHGAMVGSHSQHRSRQWMELRGEASAFRTGNRHFKQAPELTPLDLEPHFARKTRALEHFRAGEHHSGPEIGIPNISPRAHAPVRPPKPLCSKDPGPRTRPGRKSAPNSCRPSKPFTRNTCALESFRAGTRHPGPGIRIPNISPGQEYTFLTSEQKGSNKGFRRRHSRTLLRPRSVVQRATNSPICRLTVLVY